MQSSITFQGILALFIHPQSTTARKLEESFVKPNNSDEFIRICKKNGSLLYKITLVSQAKMKDVVDSLSAEHSISKGKARKMLASTIQERLGDWDISDKIVFNENLVSEQDTSKDGLNRRSLVSYVRNQAELEIIVDTICGAIGVAPDSNRKFHMSVFNLTGNAGDSPSLM